MRPWVNANMTAVAKLSHAVPAYAASVGGCQEHIRATEAFSPSMNDHLCWPQVSQCSTQPMEERPSHGLLLQDSLKVVPVLARALHAQQPLHDAAAAHRGQHWRGPHRGQDVQLATGAQGPIRIRGGGRARPCAVVLPRVAPAGLQGADGCAGG